MQRSVSSQGIAHRHISIARHCMIRVAWCTRMSATASVLMWNERSYAQPASTRNLVKLMFHQWQLNVPCLFMREPPSAPFHWTAQSCCSGLKAVQPGDYAPQHGDFQSLRAGGVFVGGEPRWAIGPGPSLASLRLVRPDWDTDPEIPINPTRNNHKTNQPVTECKHSRQHAHTERWWGGG